MEIYSHPTFKAVFISEIALSLFRGIQTFYFYDGTKVGSRLIIRMKRTWIHREALYD